MRIGRLFVPQGKYHALRKMIESYKLTDRLQHICDCPKELQLSSYIVEYRSELSTQHVMLVHKKHRVVDMPLLKRYFSKEPGNITRVSHDLARDFFDQSSPVGDMAPIGVRPSFTLLDCELFLAPEKRLFCYVGNQVHYIALTPLELLEYCYAAEIGVFSKGPLPLLDATLITKSR